MPTTAEEYPTHVHRLMALSKEDPQLRHLVPDPAVESVLAAAGLTFSETVATVFDAYGSRPALGEREYDVARDPQADRDVRRYTTRWRTVTYAETLRRGEAVASGWRHVPQWRVDPGDFVCILGFNGIDYTTLDLACLFAQSISVPLQSRLGRSALAKIFADTAPAVVAATATDAPLAAELICAQESVRALLVFDYDDRVEDERGAFEAARTVLADSGSPACLLTLAEVVAAGAAFDWEPLPPSEQGAERLALIMHSSGTTGQPKGAILLERHAQSSFKPAKLLLPRVRLCLAPMNHTMGRGTVYGTLAHGGIAYFVAKPDLSTLFEDIRLVRPTDGFFFPRALEMVYRHYQAETVRRVGRGDVDEETARAEVTAEMRGAFLGDRMCLIKGGSAPTMPEVRKFVVEGLQITFQERYGTTEAGAITMNDRVRRPHVIDYRLSDVPDLSYFATDRPYPRGELRVKTASVIPGYFKAPEASADLFDKDGFLLTGDIVEERGPDHLVYVDRRSDVLKLAQGEFVAAGALATLFEDGSDVIHQVYVYGNANRAYLLAVVVPNLELLRVSLGHEPGDAELRTRVRSEFQRVAVETGLRAFEVPRDFIIETEPFSQENGLLTALRKRARPAMLRKYGDRLEELYTGLEHKRSENLLMLRSDDTELSVTERVVRALEVVLDIVDVDLEQPSSFADLGGDSLAAADFAGLLQTMFGVAMPVDAVLSPVGTPREWAARIEAQLADGRPRSATFADVHGAGSRHLRAADLHLTAFLDPASLVRPPADVSESRPPTVLLTGATGFLGRFLLLELLEQVAVDGGRVVCLVRAPDQATAVRRLGAVFTGSDPRLEERYRSLAHDRLDVIPGDLAEVGLGLDEVQQARLAREIDRIVHTAGLVNHVLDYEHLFPSNVAGTAALVGLALTDRRKTIDFVSSGAVSPLLERSQRDDEDSPLVQQAVLDHSYANGYRTSKWSAEHLLRAAGRQHGLPVNVFRCTMMLPHRYFAGGMNVDDIFTRLLYSVIVTGIAPTSFHVPASDGSRVRAHYDGLPVDFVAAAIAKIGVTPTTGVHTFNVVNHHAEDGLSLDVFVDWIEAAGYPVTRVADYVEWLARVEAQLRTLPEERRQRSSLPVLESLRRPAAARPGTASGHFDDALRSLGIGPRTPQLGRAYIDKCLDDMCRLGLVQKPGHATPTHAKRSTAGL